MNLMNRRNFLFTGLFFLFFGQIFCQEQNNFLKDEIYAELKLLGRQYDQYVRLKISCKIQLANLLDCVMPGIKTILQGTVPANSTKDKLCDFVEKYWHYDNIKKMSEKRFIEDYGKWSKKKGYRFNESQAIAIYQLS